MDTHQPLANNPLDLSLGLCLLGTYINLGLPAAPDLHAASTYWHCHKLYYNEVSVILHVDESLESSVCQYVPMLPVKTDWKKF